MMTFIAVEWTECCRWHFQLSCSR